MVTLVWTEEPYQRLAMTPYGTSMTCFRGTVDVIDPAPVDNVVTACLSHSLQLVVSKILYDHHQFDELMCLNCPKIPSLFVCEIPVREESVGAMVWD